MGYNGFAIDTYLDAAAVTKELDELIKKPVYSIRKDKLTEYVENYFDIKCAGSKAMIGEGTDYADLEIVDELAVEFYGVAFRKGSDVRDEVNKLFDELEADGTLGALADKYSLELAD